MKCCGLAVAMPQGQQQGSSFVERATVNMGTVPVLTLMSAASGLSGLGPSSADRVGTGRSRRSTARPGEPVTSGRAAAGPRREGRCDAERPTGESRRSCSGA